MIERFTEPHKCWTLWKNNRKSNFQLDREQISHERFMVQAIPEHCKLHKRKIKCFHKGNEPIYHEWDLSRQESVLLMDKKALFS